MLVSSAAFGTHVLHGFGFEWPDEREYVSARGIAILGCIAAVLGAFGEGKAESKKQGPLAAEGETRVPDRLNASDRLGYAIRRRRLYCLAIATSTWKKYEGNRPRLWCVWPNRSSGDADHAHAGADFSQIEIHVEATGHRYWQTHYSTYLGGIIIESPDASTEIARKSIRCWIHISWYNRNRCGRRNVPLDLKIRMVKAKPIKALLYDCITRTTPQVITGN